MDLQPDSAQTMSAYVERKRRWEDHQRAYEKCTREAECKRIQQLMALAATIARALKPEECPLLVLDNDIPEVVRVACKIVLANGFVNLPGDSNAPKS